MAAMVRLFASRTHLEITAEEATREKSTFQAINREFHEAYEANLLEEEDMHIFDSRPLSDPLHLVCCNACKKPIKASQYAAHADRCGSLIFLEDTRIELDGGCSHKKPLRKGKKKMQSPYDNQGSHPAEQAKSESTDGDTETVFELIVDENTGLVSGGEVKSMMSKVPLPLATKLYYVGGNYRLKAALNHLYVESAVNDNSSNSTLNVMQGNKHDSFQHYSAKSPDQRSAQRFGSCLGGSVMGISDVTSPNQYPEGDLSKSGRVRYYTSPNSFSVTSGSVLTSMQQPNASAPVVLS